MMKLVPGCTTDTCCTCCACTCCCGCTCSAGICCTCCCCAISCCAGSCCGEVMAAVSVCRGRWTADWTDAWTGTGTAAGAGGADVCGSWRDVTDGWMIWIPAITDCCVNCNGPADARTQPARSNLAIYQILLFALRLFCLNICVFTLLAPQTHTDRTTPLDIIRD